MKDPRVVDQRVDAAEAVERLLDDALSGLDLRNVSIGLCARQPSPKGEMESEVARTR